MKRVVLNALEEDSIPIADVTPMQLLESKGSIYSGYSIGELIRNSSDQRGTTQRLRANITGLLKQYKEALTSDFHTWEI